VKSPAPAGLFFTFPAANQALDANPASFDPLVGTRQPRADALGKSGESAAVERHLAHHPRGQPHSAHSVPPVLVVEQVSDRSGLVRLASQIRTRRPTTASICRASCASTPASWRRSTRAGRRGSTSRTSSTRAIGPRRTATTTSRWLNRGPFASRSPRSCEGAAGPSQRPSRVATFAAAELRSEQGGSKLGK